MVNDFIWWYRTSGGLCSKAFLGIRQAFKPSAFFSGAESILQGDHSLSPTPPNPPPPHSLLTSRRQQGRRGSRDLVSRSSLYADISEVRASTEQRRLARELLGDRVLFPRNLLRASRSLVRKKSPCFVARKPRWLILSSKQFSSCLDDTVTSSCVPTGREGWALVTGGVCPQGTHTTGPCMRYRFKKNALITRFITKLPITHYINYILY